MLQLRVPSAQDGEILITDIDPEIFRMLLGYLYTSIPLDVKDKARRCHVILLSQLFNLWMFYRKSLHIFLMFFQNKSLDIFWMFFQNKSLHILSQDFDCSKAWNLWYATEKYILPELSESCKSKIQQYAYISLIQMKMYIKLIFIASIIICYAGVSKITTTTPFLTWSMLSNTTSR